MENEEFGSTRFEMRAPKAWLARVDDWRRHQPDIPPRAEAIRRLVERAIAVEATMARDHSNPWGPWRFDAANNVLVPVEGGKPLRDLAITAPTNAEDTELAVKRLHKRGVEPYLIGRFRLAAIEWHEFGDHPRYRLED